MSWSEAFLWGGHRRPTPRGARRSLLFYPTFHVRLMDRSVPLRTVRTSFNLSSFWDPTPETSCKLARWETRKLQIAAHPMIDKEAVRSGAR